MAVIVLAVLTVGVQEALRPTTTAPAAPHQAPATAPDDVRGGFHCQDSYTSLQYDVFLGLHSGSELIVISQTCKDQWALLDSLARYPRDSRDKLLLRWFHVTPTDGP